MGEVTLWSRSRCLEICSRVCGPTTTRLGLSHHPRYTRGDLLSGQNTCGLQHHYYSILQHEKYSIRLSRVTYFASTAYLKRKCSHHLEPSPRTRTARQDSLRKNQASSACSSRRSYIASCSGLWLSSGHAHVGRSGKTLTVAAAEYIFSHASPGAQAPPPSCCGNH